MSKRDVIQNAINVASVMGTVREDVARALMGSETHPALAEVILRLHDTQHRVDKELAELRKIALEQAMIIEMLVNQATVSASSVADLFSAIGKPMSPVGGEENV